MLNLFCDRLLGNRESISLAGSVPGNYPSNAYLLIESLENAWKRKCRTTDGIFTVSREFYLGVSLAFRIHRDFIARAYQL